MPDEWAVIWADGSISHNLSKSFKTLLGPVMEYLGTRPGFFDAHLTNGPLSPPTDLPATTTQFSSGLIPDQSTSPQGSAANSASRPGDAQKTRWALRPHLDHRVSHPPPPVYWGSRPQQPVATPFNPPLRPGADSVPPDNWATPPYAPQSPPLGQPQDTTNDQIHRWHDLWQQTQTHISDINQTLGTANGAPGLPISTPSSGGGLIDQNSSDLFMSGGGTTTQIDPSSFFMASTQMGGFDPTGISYGCTVM